MEHIIQKQVEALQEEIEKLEERLERVSDQGLPVFALAQKLQDKRDQLRNIKVFYVASTAS